MSVTFAVDYPGAGMRLVEPWWPARLLVHGRFVRMSLHGETQYMTAARDGDVVVLRFDLVNASAVYREVPETADLAKRDVREFDCVSCSREPSHDPQ